jgi:serine/threonine-protein kinase
MEKTCPKCFKKFPEGTDRCPDCRKKLIAMSERDLVGQELDDRYKILSVLGKGGMGMVYVAEQAMVGRKVALKVLRREMSQDETAVKRFFAEAKAMAALKNPHTIVLHDFGVTDDGLLYYTMELLDGRPLSAIVKHDGAMDYRRAAGLILQALDSLEEAHQHQILHRDIKPDNMFVSTRQGKEYVTVLDFGIAKLAGESSMESVTRTGMLCGTPAYLAPEQVMGTAASPASEMYSLGICLYELVAGCPPFMDATPMRLLMKHVHDAVPMVALRNPAISVPAAIDDFLVRALAKDPAARFGDAPAFRAGLKDALSLAETGGEAVAMTGLIAGPGGTRQIARGQPGAARAALLSESAGQAPRPVAPAYGEDTVISTGAGATSTEALVAGTLRPRRTPLWIGIGVAVAAAVALAVWRPWSSEPAADKSADSAQAASAPATPAQSAARAPTTAEPAAAGEVAGGQPAANAGAGAPAAPAAVEAVAGAQPAAAASAPTPAEPEAAQAAAGAQPATAASAPMPAEPEAAQAAAGAQPATPSGAATQSPTAVEPPVGTQPAAGAGAGAPAAPVAAEAVAAAQPATPSGAATQSPTAAEPPVGTQPAAGAGAGAPSVPVAAEAVAGKDEKSAGKKKTDKQAGKGETDKKKGAASGDLGFRPVKVDSGGKQAPQKADAEGKQAPKKAAAEGEPEPGPEKDDGGLGFRPVTVPK